MPLAIVAHIRSRLRVVGAIGLHAVGDAIAAARTFGNCNRAIVICNRTIVILVIVIARRIVARPAIVGA